MTIGRNIERLKNRICMFQFSCKFGFLSSFRLSNWTPKITNFDAVSRKFTNFDEVQCFKHIPKLIIFGIQI